ncbi:MAG: ABC transporter permease [Clostridiaceae bacterium]
MGEFLNTYNDILSVIGLSLFVSLTATLIASFLGILSGIPYGLNDFKGKGIIDRISDTLLSMPPVLMGLLVYMLLSRKGPLGSLRILFTPTAMIISQVLLVTPIVFTIVKNAVSTRGRQVRQAAFLLGANKSESYKMIIKECAIDFSSAVTTGFGRAISEVGAVMMVGGNIKGHTRVMTTYIAMETGKGNFDEAVIIGLILLLISFLINVLLFLIKKRSVNEY